MFMCGDCHPITELQVVYASVASAAIVTASFLAPVAVLTSVLRKHLSRKKHGTTRLTSDELLALMSQHGVLRALSRTGSALKLIFGGLILELGYIVEVGAPSPFF